MLFICFACNMVGRGVGDSYIVFLLPLSEEFGWGRAQVSSVYSVYLVTSGLAAPLTGMMVDRWGARVVYATGLALLGSACVVAGHLTQLWQFHLAVGGLVGMGVSMLGMVPATMLISRWFRDRMSSAMGVAYAGFGTGTLVVVPLAQYSIELQGWRGTYLLMGSVVLVLLPLIFLMPWKAMAGSRRARKADAPDAALPSPLRAAVRSRPYWQIVQVFSFTAIGMHSMIVQVVPFLVQVGLTPLSAATSFGIAGLLSVFGMMASGWSTDRVGYRFTATSSFVATLLGMGSLVLLSYFGAHWLVVPFVLLVGISMGARGPIVATLAAKQFAGAGFATIYGTIFACMSTGAAIGAWTSGALYDLSGGYRAGFLFSMTCMCIAAAPFWMPRPLGARASTFV